VKCQGYDELKQELNEKLDSLELVKNENSLLKDSINTLSQDYFNPFNSENYDAELDYISEDGSYTFNQKDSIARLYVRIPEGLFFVYIEESEIKLYVSPPNDSTSRTYLIEQSNLKWYK
jgi:DNA phosphorothioation-dependent restriction protein DptG